MSVNIHVVSKHHYENIKDQDKNIGLESTSTADEFGLCGVGVTCLPRDPRFMGSNSAEVDGFFRT